MTSPTQGLRSTCQHDYVSLVGGLQCIRCGHQIVGRIPRPENDEAAVMLFAEAMRAKMAFKREQGYSGWETCPIPRLRQMLHEHLNKGDPVDVANFCMMLWTLTETQE